MSSVLAVDDVIQITYRGTIFQQSVMSVMHARVVTAPASATNAELQLEDLADKLGDPAESLFLTNYLEATSISLFLNDVIVQRIKPTRTIYAQKSIAEFGRLTDTAGTANIAASVEKRSMNVSRKGIGRLQLPGIPSVYVISGRIDADYKADKLSNLASSMFGNFSGGATYAGVYAWCLPAGGTDHSYDLWDAIPKDTARTMHRRTVGLGI